MPKVLTTAAWVEKAKAIHGDRYDYSGSVYESAHSLIRIRCPEHGEFIQKAYSHLNGRGCAGCQRTKLKAPRIGRTTGRTAQEEFLERARAVHGDRYDYSQAVYQQNHTKLTVICREHGPFQVTPKNHIRAESGCMRCYHAEVSQRQFLTQDEFLDAARAIHGDRYDYSKSIYTRATDKIIIGCPDHGEFLQSATSHIHQESGCPSCTHRVSKTERVIGDFIESLGVRVIRNDLETLKPKLGRAELDILLPDQKIAVEYCGLLWHSDRFKGDHIKHLRKQKACEELGIRLITIFEDEWLTKQEIVKAFFRHLLGKSPRGFSGRQATLKEIPWSQAKEFLEQHHLLGAGSPPKYRMGAFGPDGSLLAVMTFGSPSDERGAAGVIEMKRLVTDKRNHPGLPSKMFQWALREWGFHEVLAFVDRRWFQGGFKLISGFQQQGETEPTLWWTDGVQRVKRRHFTKRELQELEPYRGQTLSKREMLARLGWFRIWDCGKLRLVWHG